MLKRNDYSFRWRFAHFALKILFKVFAGVKTLNFERLNIPDKPVIIVANHSSYMDPPLIMGFWNREIFFLGHSGLFKNPIFGSFLRFFNGIPLPKGYKEAYRILGKGYDIGIFPEGGRNKLPEVKKGAFKLSIDTGCPIIVFGIYGNRGRVFEKVFRWVFKRELKLVYLKTLYPEDYKDENEMMEEFKSLILNFLQL